MIAPVRLLSGHTDFIRSVAFSPDGRLLASGANDKTLRVWEPATGEACVYTDHTDYVTAVAFSPLGDRVASGSSDKTARLWDPFAGTCVATLAHPDAPAFFGDILGGLTWLRFSRDGRQLATITSTPAVYLWDLATGSERRFEGLKKTWCGSVDVSPDGTWLAAATLEKTARIWSTATGRCRLLKGHAGKGSKVGEVAFSSDGRFLATAAAWDAATYLWDLTSLAGTALTSSSPGAVTWSNSEMAISPDATWLARANHDNTVELWDVSAASLAQAGGALTGKSLRPHAMVTQGLCFSPDSRLLATADVGGAVLVSEVPSGRPVARATLAAKPSSMVYSPDGRRIAFAVGPSIAVVDLDAA